MLQNICNHIPDQMVSHHIYNLHKNDNSKNFQGSGKKQKNLHTCKQCTEHTFLEILSSLHSNEILNWEFKYMQTIE